MKKQTYTARVTRINARHYPRRNLSGQCAKMSLWAETERGDEVWLATEKGIGTRRIETKMEEMEEKYGFMIGQEIRYILKSSRWGSNMTGFLTPRGSAPENYKTTEQDYLNQGEGI